MLLPIPPARNILLPITVTPNPNLPIHRVVDDDDTVGLLGRILVHEDPPLLDRQTSLDLSDDPVKKHHNNI